MHILVGELQSVLICFRFNSEKQVGILGIWVFILFYVKEKLDYLGIREFHLTFLTTFLKASPLSQPRYIYRLVK